MGSNPGWGTKIPHAVCTLNKIKQFLKKVNGQKKWMNDKFKFKNCEFAEVTYIWKLVILYIFIENCTEIKSILIKNRDLIIGKFNNDKTKGLTWHLKELVKDR